MPLQYHDLSISASTRHTRDKASLFDVSHMLQVKVSGKDRIRFLESLIVGDLAELPLGRSMLSVYTNSAGRIIDDAIFNAQSDHIYIVSNAGCAEKDFAHLRRELEHFKGDALLDRIEDRSLLALQGPCSAHVLEKLSNSSLRDLFFMSTRSITIAGIPCHVSRSGYTGEDGFEIRVSSDAAEKLANSILEQKEVKLAGLGARDSLRLEAGLCLYGHDIDENISPVEAGLSWLIGKRRREEGGFLGYNVIQSHLKDGIPRKRVGLIVSGAPAREGSKIYSNDGNELGMVTSGGPSPCFGKNIAMGYVKTGYHKTGTTLQIRVRDRMSSAEIVRMPFVPTKYYLNK